MGRPSRNPKQLRWTDLSHEDQDALSGKLVGLCGAADDAAAFDSLAVEKQQALLLVLERLKAKALWHTVRSIDNVYGLGGVGIEFRAWPMIHSELSRHRDFTALFARHKDTSGGFYEKGREDAVLHFLFRNGDRRQWYVHFDLYSPIYSLAGFGRHLRYEVLGKHMPDWRMIRQCLKARQ